MCVGVHDTIVVACGQSVFVDEAGPSLEPSVLDDVEPDPSIQPSTLDDVEAYLLRFIPLTMMMQRQILLLMVVMMTMIVMKRWI